MMRVRFLVILLFTMVLVDGSLARAGSDDAQQKAEALLKQADARVASLRDFKANLRARTRLSLLPAVDLVGHVYFKRPNHLKVDVENMPRMLSRVRQQMQVEPPYQNRKMYQPRWVRAEDLEGRPCEVIEFKARAASTRLQLATVWLERSSGTVPKSILDYSDGSQATVTTMFSKIQTYLLPQTSEVDMNSTGLHVVASVSYTDYVLNSNLPDSLFEKTK